VEDIALLRTKLYRPPLTLDLVLRPRLQEWIDLRRRPLTLVCAPTGYGKTTLVSSWLQRLSEETPPVPGTWLSLDEKDNDSVQFASYLLAAVRTLNPDYAKQCLLGVSSQ
jgi:LuxR family maltose regulon positive regulatory protein